MIKGIGMDIVEIGRLSRVLSRQPRLPERILTLREQDVFYALSEKETAGVSGRTFCGEGSIRKSIRYGNWSVCQLSRHRDTKR